MERHLRKTLTCGLILIMFAFVLLFCASAYSVYAKASSDIIESEFTVVDKRVDTEIIYTGKSAIPVTSYIVTIDMEGVSKDITVSNDIFGNILEGQNVMCNVYYSSQGKLVDIAIE